MMGATEANGQIVKPKRKSSEKRKAKSRDAARVRRSNEADIFNDLTLEIPLPLDVLAHCDKASLIRLVICNIKLQKFISDGLILEIPLPLDVLAHCDKASLIRLVICNIKLQQFISDVLKPERSGRSGASDSLFLSSLDGFLMVVRSSGDLLYISENVFSMLGIAQVDMLGQKVYEFIHPCDHECIKNEITTRSEAEHVFSVRMRTSYNSKSHCFSGRTPDYKVVCCTGHTVSSRPSSGGSSSRSCVKVKAEQYTTIHGEDALEDEDLTLDLSQPRADADLYTVIVGRLIVEPETSSLLKLDCSSFVTRHTPDMKCLYCDERVVSLLGYQPEDMIGKSLYDFHHPFDDGLIKKAYKILFTSGQMMIPCYRFLRRRGGYSWLETKAVLIGGKPQQQPALRTHAQQLMSREQQEVLCIHCIVSEPQCTSALMSDVQQKCSVATNNRTLATLLTCDQKDAAKCRTVPAIQSADERGLNLSIAGDDVVGADGGDDEDEDCMQFMTEEILGLTSTDSTKIFERLLKPDCCEVIDDPLEDMYEMKAPYIPLDDMSFATLSDLKDISILDSIAPGPVTDISQGLAGEFFMGGIKQGSDVSMTSDRGDSQGTENFQDIKSSGSLKMLLGSDRQLSHVSSDTQLVNDLINICSRPNRTKSENELLDQLIQSVTDGADNEDYRKCVNILVECMSNNEPRPPVKFVVTDDDEDDDDEAVVSVGQDVLYTGSAPGSTASTLSCNSPSDYIVVDTGSGNEDSCNYGNHSDGGSYGNGSNDGGNYGNRNNDGCYDNSSNDGNYGNRGDGGNYGNDDGNYGNSLALVGGVDYGIGIINTIDTQAIRLDSFNTYPDIGTEIICLTNDSAVVNTNDQIETPSVVYVDFYVEPEVDSAARDDSETDEAPEEDDDDDYDDDDDDDNVVPGDSSVPADSSVLRNLLLLGVDVNYGYQLQRQQQQQSNQKNRQK